ncbi:MAG: VanZ family protein [Candidatus Marinimicrobia bacterium]|nr:VanZ family protein [Candidatus Neomarinimicrobiota bacterium]
MNPDRRTFFAFCTSAAYAIVLMVFLLLPSDSLPKIKILSVDKIWHFLSYFILTLALMFSFREGRYRIWFSRRWSFIIAMIHGGLTEILQGFIPGRSAGMDDWIANCLGIATAILGFKLFPKFFEKQK